MNHLNKKVSEQDSRPEPLFVKNIKFLIQTHKLNPTKLAQITKIPVPTIHRLLNQTADPRSSTLRILTEFFECSIDDLLNEDLSTKWPFISTMQNTQIPVLNWKEAIHHESEAQAAKKWISVDKAISQKGFALE